MSAICEPFTDSDGHELWIDLNGHVQYVGMETGTLKISAQPGWRRVHLPTDTETSVPCVLDEHDACNPAADITSVV